MTGKPRGRPLVQLEGCVVVAAAIVFQSQPEERSGMRPIGLHGSLIERTGFFRLATEGCNRRTSLVQVLGRLLHRARQAIEDAEGSLEIATGTQGFRDPQVAHPRIVPRTLGRLEAGDRPGVVRETAIRQGLIVMSQGAAVAGSQSLDRLGVPTEQVLTNTQPNRRRRRMRFSPIQLGHGVPEHGETRRILPHRVHDLVDFLGTERSIRQDRITNIEIHELSHDLRYLLLCLVSR